MKRLIILFIVLILPCGAVFSQKKETYKVHTVVIDPGHGGAKPGARGSRSYEKNITLDVAKKFGKLIKDNYPDVKVIFTRTNDADISLAERARIANRNKADLFISIHANSHPTSVPNGVETFVMGLSESKANLEVAKKENADILLEADYKDNSDYSVFDPNSPESYVLLTLFQNSFLEKSLNFAQAIQSQYMRNLKTINRGVKQAELFVLYKTTCPSVLTEIGFISNPNEEAFMLSDEGQAKIAVSLFNAFMNFKATEEGSNKPANPKFDIPGYKAPKQAKPAETQNEAKPEPTPAVVAVADAEKETSQASEPKAQHEPAPKAQTEPKAEVVQVAEPAKEEAKPAEPVTPAPAVEQAAPPAKPTPTVELPPQPVKQEQPVAEPQPEPQPTPAPQPAAEPKNEAPAAPVQEIETLMPPQNTASADATSYYTVQFLTMATLYKAGAPELQGISDFQTFRQGKVYAYITGRFATQQEAAAYCAHVRRTTTFRDAWAYQYKGPAAEKPQQPAATPAKPAPTAKKGLTFRVQFCTATRNMKAGDPDLQGIKDIHTGRSGRFYIYTAGDYATQQEAQQRCNSIRKQTSFKDAMVIAIYNGERITLERAAEIQKRK